MHRSSWASYARTGLWGWYECLQNRESSLELLKRTCRSPRAGWAHSVPAPESRRIDGATESVLLQKVFGRQGLDEVVELLDLGLLLVLAHVDP